MKGMSISAVGRGWEPMMVRARSVQGPHSLECGCLTVNCSVDDVVEVDGMHC
jgi:hypothetical protein